VLELAVVGSAPLSRVHVPPLATAGDVRDTTDGARAVFTTRPAESVALTTTAGESDVRARAAVLVPVVPPPAVPIVKIGVATSFATEPKNVTVFVARTVVTPAALVTETV
jgi:hypothetical protein